MKYPELDEEFDVFSTHSIDAFCNNAKCSPTVDDEYVNCNNCGFQNESPNATFNYWLEQYRVELKLNKLGL